MPRPRATRIAASPLRYPGGKGALYPRLRALIRAAGLAGGTYVEPYAGGAGAGLALLVTGQVTKLVINDLDPAIFAFWKLSTSAPDRLIHRLQSVPLTIAEWRRQKEILRTAGPTDYEDLGFAAFYLNRTNRSGVLNAGPIGGLDQSGKYKIDARFNRERLARQIEIIKLHANDIRASSCDGIEVIEEYCSADKAFIYADPPYFEKAGSLYLNSFRPDDHMSLAATLNNHPYSNWLLTYDNVPEVHSYYCDRRRFMLELNYSANGARRATEIAVLSDSLPATGVDWATN